VDASRKLGGTMTKLIAPVAGLALSAVIAVVSAHAAEVASCSAAGSVCRTNVRAKIPASDQASWNARCDEAVAQCRSRCQGGTKVFVGISDGAPHTVGSCK